jgi:hypothetical protein
MTYTSGGTFQTALFRALIVGIVAGATAAIGVYASTDSYKPVVVAFVTAFLGSAAVRGLVEGSIDSGRQRAGEVVAADVQAGTAGDA